jgi:predicted MFS family arabinose efflux permease
MESPPDGRPDAASHARRVSRGIPWVVVVAALGYFVDIYDLVLFSILRVPSLKGLGVAEASLKTTGAWLLDIQLVGMMVGGVVLGIYGDKKGRLGVVFGSILLYSVANFANAFVHSVDAYAAVRFLAGFGLAGELGAGITLVSELLPKERRGLGTTIVASVGLSGALAAGALAELLLSRYGAEGWRVAYGVGGAMGLALLALRVGVLESDLFARMKESQVARGDVRLLFRPRERLLRFLRVIAVGVPIWFAGGVLFVFAPEIGRALGLSVAPTGARTIFWAYLGVVVGDVTSGVVSQRLKSRKRVIAAFLTGLAFAFIALCSFGGRSSATFYALMTVIGFATGYWVLFVTTASEQFGTNLRATVTTSAPNFVRGTAIPVAAVWLLLTGPLGTVTATWVVGLATIALSLVALAGMKESFDADLDRHER